MMDGNYDYVKHNRALQNNPGNMSMISYEDQQWQNAQLNSLAGTNLKVDTRALMTPIPGTEETEMLSSPISQYSTQTMSDFQQLQQEEKALLDARKRQEEYITENIIGDLSEQYRYTGMNVCVLPGENCWNDISNMTSDAINNTNVRASSSFDQLYKTGDMVKQNMTIRGDPYWLCNPHLQNIAIDASYVFNMMTPARRQSGDNEDMSPEYNKCNSIWGIYNIINITHNFKQGKFTQDIEAVMNPNFRFPIYYLKIIHFQSDKYL